MKLNFLKSDKNSFLKFFFKATLLFVLILSVITTSLSFVYDSKYKAGNVVFAPSIVYTFAGGGTLSNPYQINNATDLNNLATNVNNGTTYSGKYFKLTTNINLNNISFTPIGNTSYRYFSGTFDGGNHIIEGLNVTVTTAYAGLFGCVSGATIKNIIVNGAIDVCCVTGSSYAGGIAGYSKSISTFYNCANWATVRNTGNRYTVSAGGIVGYVSGTSSTKFTLCKNLGNIYAGSYETSNYYHYHYAGGIIGYGSPTITKCCNSGTVSAGGSYSQSAYAAGIVGSGGATISYCYNTGTVSAYAKEITTTYYFNLHGIYKVGENGTIKTRYDLTSSTIPVPKLSYETYVSDDYDKYGSSNTIHYGKTRFGAYTNYMEPTDDKDYFSEYTDKSWQKKYVITKDAYASGISNYGNLNNCYNKGTISSGGYYNVQWIFNLKCRYVNKSSKEQIFEFNFESSRSDAISLYGTISSNCYYLNNTTYNLCSYRINSGKYKYLYYGTGHSKEISVDVGGKQTHYFSIEKELSSDDIYFYIQNEKKNGTKGDIFSSCSAGNIKVFNENPYITYEQKASERGTQSSNIKTVFNGDSIWATDPAINNGYPYIKEMYW